MKKVKVKCRRCFEVEYEFPIDDEVYRLVNDDYEDLPMDVENDLITEAFNRFDEDLHNWTINRLPENMKYDSDYLIKTDQGVVSWAMLFGR